ncbi:MAG: aminomethyl-transferring glycine dehydrogenase subunit GcvPA [Lacrimispora saccharolytica]
MGEKSYPYIPNSNEKIRNEMLKEIGVREAEELYSFIPKKVRMNRPLSLPKPLESEQELKKHMEKLLGENITCGEYLNFLGAGCYDHYVPAVCDEINGRSEFLTAYSGDTYGDHGKCQAIFEFTSMMGELLKMDVVGFPTYDGGQAAGTALMMAGRINKRREVLVPAHMNPELFKQLSCYCQGMELIKVEEQKNGQADLKELKSKISQRTAAVFIQNPAFLGFFEEQAEEIGKLAHQAGAEFIVYADPSSLGVCMPPADYGADIVCGEIQPLGIHMSYGGGLGGYLATRQEEVYVMNYPHHLYSLFENSRGQFGYARALPERTSYYARENAVEYLGTCVGLWAITAAVYLAVMGPDGMRELGENILVKSSYARKKLSAVPGVEELFPEASSFMEFSLRFDKTGLTAAEIGNRLLKKGIFGGLDLSRSFPEFGQSMLICVTEKTEFEEIDRLAQALTEILKEKKGQEQKPAEKAETVGGEM